MESYHKSTISTNCVTSKEEKRVLMEHFDNNPDWQSE